MVKFLCSQCAAVLEADQAMLKTDESICCSSCNTTQELPADVFSNGVIWGDFVLKREIGSGANGHVFLSVQRSLDRLCAVKVLHRDLTYTDEKKQEFRQEAKIAAGLNHPQIVQCYFADELYGSSYFAMEYVSGLNLKQVLKNCGPLPENDVILLGLKVATALDYAWKKEQVVHCDLKPDNILVTDEGHIKLTDLGLAVSSRMGANHQGDEIKGTPYYIAPEQIVGETLTCRTDIYSLGTVMYECLTGRYVFNGPSAEDICKKHMEEEPVPVSTYDDSVSPELCAIIERMLFKHPDDRFQTFDELIGALQLLINPDFQTMVLSTDSGAFNFQTQLITRRPESVEKSSGHTLVLMLLLTLCMVLGAGGFYYFSMQPDQAMADSPSLAEPALVMPQMKVTALMPDPRGFDQGAEWVELTNHSAVPVSVGRWMLRDNEEKFYHLPEVTLAPNASHRFTLHETDLVLNNSGDGVDLLHPSMQVVDRLAYSGELVVEGQPISQP